MEIKKMESENMGSEKIEDGMQDRMQDKKTMAKDLTKGSVIKLLLLFAAPLFLSNALQAIYNIVDMIVVGQVIGGDGMSAVAIGGNVLGILNFIVMGFAGAGQIIIAKSVGQKDFEAVKRTIGTMFTLLLAAAVVMSVACFFLRDWLLELVNTPKEAYQYTMDYTLVCMAGLVFIYGYNIVSAIMRGMGDSKRPFMFVAIASVINIILDILFVAVFHMEVRGAALATVIGQGISFLYALWYFYQHKEAFGFDFKPRSFIPDGATVRGLCALGIPMAIQSAAITISMTVVAAWVNSFGVVYSACAGVLNKLNMLVGIMTMSLTTAAGSMVGQNLGAKKYNRISKILLSTTACTSVIVLIYIAVLVLFPEMMIGLFTSDAAILASASIIVLPSVVNAFGSISRSFAFAIINGSGNSKLNLLVAIIDGMIARIALAYILGWKNGMGPQGFWLGDALAGFVPFLIGFTYFMSGSWKKEKTLDMDL